MLGGIRATGACTHSSQPSPPSIVQRLSKAIQFRSASRAATAIDQGAPASGKSSNYLIVLPAITPIALVSEAWYRRRHRSRLPCLKAPVQDRHRVSWFFSSRQKQIYQKGTRKLVIRDGQDCCESNWPIVLLQSHGLDEIERTSDTHVDDPNQQWIQCTKSESAAELR